MHNKELDVGKVSTTENPADLPTKHLKLETVLKHVSELGGRVEQRRASTALKLNAVAKDSWDTSGAESGRWIRQHKKLRACLFTPMKVAGGPITGNEVGSRRITRGVFKDGERFIHEDNWRASADPHFRLTRLWQGVTEFVT